MGWAQESEFSIDFSRDSDVGGQELQNIENADTESKL